MQEFKRPVTGWEIEAERTVTFHRPPFLYVLSYVSTVRTRGLANIINEYAIKNLLESLLFKQIQEETNTFYKQRRLPPSLSFSPWLQATLWEALRTESGRQTLPSSLTPGVRYAREKHSCDAYQCGTDQATQRTFPMTKALTLPPPHIALWLGPISCLGFDKTGLAVGT